MSVLTEIYDGWKNLIFENQAVEIEAKKRISICVNNKCRKFNKRKFCEACGCYMPAKVRSVKSKCILGYW